MALVFEVAFASIAAILSVLSLKTLRAISHLGVGKPFWIPVFVSSLLFSTGSIVAIFRELSFLPTANTDELVQVSRLLALCILAYGIYSYSRKVNESLTEEFSIPEKISEESLEVEGRVEEVAEIEAPIQKRRAKERAKTETAPECKHQFGYLRTLPRNASIPDECLGCERIVECKHSSVNDLKSYQSQDLKEIAPT